MSYWQQHSVQNIHKHCTSGHKHQTGPSISPSENAWRMHPIEVSKGGIFCLWWGLFHISLFPTVQQVPTIWSTTFPPPIVSCLVSQRGSKEHKGTFPWRYAGRTLAQYHASRGNSKHNNTYMWLPATADIALMTSFTLQDQSPMEQPEKKLQGKIQYDSLQRMGKYVTNIFPNTYILLCG